MSVIVAMCLFSLSMSISPGPVNLITLSTGVNHGIRNALPFVTGATIGFTLLLLFVGMGMGQLAAENEGLMQTLGVLGSGFICYMGYKVATAEPSIDVADQSRPTFWQGFLLQWINPKAWVACLAGVSAFNLTGPDNTLWLFVSLYGLVCYPAIASWAVVGSRIRYLLTDPLHIRTFNRLMGLTLIAVALYLIYWQQS